MPKKPSRSSGANARLLVLGMLRRAPMHGYEIRRLVEQNQTGQWAHVLPGSIYHALGALEKDGLVEVADTAARGRQQRAIYTLTKAGQEAYLTELRAAWQRVPDSLPADLYVTLTFWQDLPADELITRIDASLAHLRAQYESWTQGEAAKSRAMLMPEWLIALFRNGREHLEADIRLLESFRRTLTSAAL